LEYLALPAEKYSVLDAATIFKKSSNEFTYVVQPVSFMGNTLEAVIDAIVDVSPYPEGKSVIRVVGCTLEGGQFAAFANRSARSRRQDLKNKSNGAIISVNCEMEIRAVTQPSFKRWLPLIPKGQDSLDASAPVNFLPDGPSTLSVDCNLEISALIPREGSWIPRRLVGKAGSMVTQQLLNLLVPKFVEQVAADYRVWGAGDDSRSPVINSTEETICEFVEKGYENELLDQEVNDQESMTHGVKKKYLQIVRQRSRRIKNAQRDKAPQDNDQDLKIIPARRAGLRSLHRSSIVRRKTDVQIFSNN